MMAKLFQIAVLVFELQAAFHGHLHPRHHYHFEHRRQYPAIIRH